MRSQTLNRQIIYAAVIVVLFCAMYPYKLMVDAAHRKYDLGDATIGIDNGSFVLNLFALGGFRGFVVNFLWDDAIKLQKYHQWDRLDAKVDMITKLQPHFLSVWNFQGWNLAYNVSVEWDDPADKYRYIKRGINFLKQGVQRNPRSPDLVWDTAWTYYHKIGMADEAVVLRKLFHDDEDEEFKREPINNDIKNDNYLLGYGWFKKAIQLVDAGGNRLAPGVKLDELTLVDPNEQKKGRPGDLNFRASPAHAQTRYSVSLEKASIKNIPATFGEKAKNEWLKARDEWVEFGRHPFPAHNNENELILLDQIDDPTEFDKLTDNQRYWTNRWSDQTNYRYWKDRASAEMEVEGYSARQCFYEGTKALRAGQFITETGKDGVVKKGAVDWYREGLDLWKTLLDRHPTFATDRLNLKDTGLIVRRYVQSLRNAGEEIPEDYPFKELLAEAEADTSVDPYDALEVLRTSASRPEGVP